MAAAAAGDRGASLLPPGRAGRLQKRRPLQGRVARPTHSWRAVSAIQMPARIGDMIAQLGHVQARGLAPKAPDQVPRHHRGG